MSKIIFTISLLTAICFAKPDDYKLATWNLQGSSATTENKWNVSVRQIVSGDNPADILAVQEAGVLPHTARATGRSQSQGNVVVSEYLWQLGSFSRPDEVNIYYANIDTGANRVNLAIVSRMIADEIIILPPPSVASRPIIGIRIDNDVFFNIHALANGGTDVPAIVNSVFDHFRNRPEITWTILGDFNRSPDSLLASLGLEVRTRTWILNPNAPTQRSGGTLDYAIVGNSSGRIITTALTAVLMLANLRTHLVSDHFPVNFRKLGGN
ncbi:cytolethal distending toxin subunit B family protein [Campylobacter mucosalis]|uniref:Cytolethal distending toxin, subunit CdtB n=1 Tax=Campylobacter mucosalis CCUG 21559 TaxID=1032067 RepID=A0A6G5QEN9_9BACT|nr:cytolethal distending toxin subunit B family protein [Campylobacter mucosalis]KEA45884.1 cytolethal distending toxin subunit CdtB [Campylobacter mucosalis]QCD44059.1 cytolethal distending toxin, subunit CdtB [Campylobacter mucosalis CCUG 21559]QKF62417.1 cytolethal distending toxin, subunit CdtB [Campylobacter mucosalis]BAU25672.1 cytolethal distending toxin B [Campylobacter mucosalis CCUG 21559]